MDTDYDEFLQTRVQPQHRAIVERFCEQMSEVGPQAPRRMRGGSEKYYSVPVYTVKRDIVAISPTKTGITFSFTYGASFEDRHGTLTGSGKRSRTVRVSKLETYPEEAIADFIRQAVALDLCKAG